MPSARYRQLSKQIRQLKRLLLPREIDKDILELTPRLSVRALSFRLLAHAEIEHYLEDRVLEIAMAADAAWKGRKHVSHTTLCLLAFSGIKLDSLPDTIKPPPKKKQSDWDSKTKPDKRISLSISHFCSSIRLKNNGIKEDNVIGMILPIGVEVTQLDELLVAEMNDFGSKRGEAAHRSVYGHVTAGVNPRDEYNQVSRIVDGLKELDGVLDTVHKRAK